MIKLAVEEYCSECPGFEPACSQSMSMREGGQDELVTTVYCARRAMCAKLVKRYQSVSLAETEGPTLYANGMKVEMR